MKFSIICPAYNAKRYLAEAIESVLSQTHKDWELIIVDDCSVDGSDAIIEEYIKKDGRIRAFKNNVNKGQFFSRKRGIEESLGEAIVFLDGDDILKKDCLETLAKKFLEYPNLDCIVYNCDQILEDGLPIQNIDKIDKPVFAESNLSFYKATFNNRTIPTVWRYCFKRDLLEKVIKLNLTCNTKLGEDMFFLTVASLNVSNAFLMADSLYSYRLHSNSICHSLDSNKAFDRFRSHEISYAYVNSVSPSFLDDVPNRVINLISWSVAKYLELGSLEDDRRIFKKRCIQIKKSFIWNRFVKRHKFESKYPNLIVFCFKIGCLPFIKSIAQKQKQRNKI